MVNGLQVFCDELDELHKVYFMNITHKSRELIELINSNIVSICEGNSNSNVEDVKKELLGFLESKGSSTMRTGAAAEFFIHLLLNILGFKQECLFTNLEERSIKKGFDGYYSYDGYEWIVESKSTISNLLKRDHVKKIKESYDDLESKITGKPNKDGRTQNNPWKNAYNHACHIDVGASKSIHKNIKKFSDEYRRGVYHDMRMFNIVPSSTVFLTKNWKQVDFDYIKRMLHSNISTYEANSVIFICATEISVELLQECLKE